jgi:hypothetical protein
MSNEEQHGRSEPCPSSSRETCTCGCDVCTWARAWLALSAAGDRAIWRDDGSGCPDDFPDGTCKDCGAGRSEAHREHCPAVLSDGS